MSKPTKPGNWYYKGEPVAVLKDDGDFGELMFRGWNVNWAVSLTLDSDWGSGIPSPDELVKMRVEIAVLHAQILQHESCLREVLGLEEIERMKAEIEMMKKQQLPKCEHALVACSRFKMYRVCADVKVCERKPNGNAT